jgi:hypothetical protein
VVVADGFEEPSFAPVLGEVGLESLVVDTVDFAVLNLES